VKIRAVKPFVVDELGTNRVFVKVYTDEGLTGLGEGTLSSRSQSIAAAIAENEAYLLGKDPRDIEGLWQTLYRRPRWRGGPILNSAISAIDTALWDILGKSLGVPIYRLLGGACRDRVRISTGVGGLTPEEAADNARALVEAGYTCMKAGPYPLASGTIERGQPAFRGPITLNPHEIVRRSVAKVRAIREAVGDDVDIQFDCHGVFTPVMAVEFARRVEEYRPMFLEEATQAEDLDSLAWLGARTAAPLATGERLFTKWGFADLVARHLVSYAQPDIAHCGGVSEMKKIAAMAEAHFVDLAPHHGNGEVTTYASLHVDFCSPNCVVQERPRHTALAAELHGEVLEIENGYARLPTRPGLGLDLDENVAARHPYVAEYELRNRAHLTWADGSIADP
jgi:galactonate dehydratase